MDISQFCRQAAWRVALVLCATGFAAPILAADFYTSPGGNDSNSCTSTTEPCQTIQAAIDKANAGDTVHVGEGSYPFTSNRIVIDVPGLKLIGENSPFDPSSAPGAPVLAANASILQGATAEVSSGTSGMIWVDNVPNVEVRNLYIELDGSCPSGSWGCLFFGEEPKTNEAVVATGAIDGLVVDNNYIKVVGGTSTSAISINVVDADDTSVPDGLPRTPGQFVTISNNAVEPDTGANAGAKRAIAMERGAGLIDGNQVAAIVQDMWIRSSNGGTASNALTISNNWYFGRLQLYLSAGTNLSETVIEGNHFDLGPVRAQGGGFLGNGSETLSIHVAGGSGSAPTRIRNNSFAGFGQQYRALWIMDRPNIIVEGNTFTPAAGEDDFTAILVGNRAAQTGNPPAPNPFDVVIRGNIFNANGAPAGNKGKAIVLVDDNDQNGAAGFEQAVVGGSMAGDANHFDAALGWYIVLDDRICDQLDHNSCSTGGSSYPIGAAVAYSGGNNQASQKRPFGWDVVAVGNAFGGVAMGDMTQAEYDAVLAKTWDTRTAITNPADTGLVLYNCPPATGCTITFSPTSFIYDGSAHTITASLDQAPTATCTVVPQTVTDPGDTVVIASCPTAAYIASGSATIHVATADQAITGFAASPANPTYSPSGSFTVSATGGGSGNPVVFASATPGVCTVSGSTVTMLSAGTCSLTADQAGNANYNPAPQVTLDVTISPAAATITLDAGTLSAVYDGSAHTVTATTTPAGLSYSVTYDGSNMAPTDAGSYAVVTTITDPNYSGSDSGTLVIAKADQAITGFAASPANPTWSPNGSFTVSATGGGSGNPVVFASATPAVCTVSGSTVTMLSAGTCSLTAGQAGNANYNPAPQATLDVIISEPPQPDAAVTVTDFRQYQRYGELLTYEVTVSNLGNTDLAAVQVSAPLPADLGVATPSWVCTPDFGASCTANGSGMLSDTASLPQGTSVTYSYNAWVIDGPGLDESIELTATASISASGSSDVDSSNDSATDQTTVVLFRDGFEDGGDGAEPAFALPAGISP